MNIQTITNGFKYCGVYPFDRQNVLDRVSVVTDSSSNSPTAIDTPGHGYDKDHRNDMHFTVEQEEQFKMHFEEGYDFPGPEYELWLTFNQEIASAETTANSIESYFPDVHLCDSLPPYPHNFFSSGYCQRHPCSLADHSLLTQVHSISLHPLNDLPWNPIR